MNSSPRQFATTQWTLIWQASQKDLPAGTAALEELVCRYWQPLYSFARGRGLSPQDAEDATQEFLHRISQGEFLAAANPAHGRFRHFLLVAWERFLVDDYRRRMSQKRGGGLRLLQVDFSQAEENWLHLNHSHKADDVFAAHWAMNLVHHAQERLRQFLGLERSKLFDVLGPYLSKPMDSVTYKELGVKLGMSPAAVRVAMHRMRAKFAAIVRECILETLDDPADMDAEIAALIAAWPKDELPMDSSGFSS
ncbi:MAG: sigma-70 family RNA polymerase sigma factor [Planctomycetales bacterium]|nr:sigma-70 family RNA polymerase sigma factor [Planctomycetales bacterium]